MLSVIMLSAILLRVMALMKKCLIPGPEAGAAPGAAPGAGANHIFFS